MMHALLLITPPPLPPPPPSLRRKMIVERRYYTSKLPETNKHADTKESLPAQSVASSFNQTCHQVVYTRKKLLPGAIGISEIQVIKTEFKSSKTLSFQISIIYSVTQVACISRGIRSKVYAFLVAPMVKLCHSLSRVTP